MSHTIRAVVIAGTLALLASAARAQGPRQPVGGASAVVPPNQFCQFTSQTSCTINHGLNTTNILAQCRAGAAGDGAAIAITSLTGQTVNAVTLNFASSTGRCVVNGTGGVGTPGTPGASGASLTASNTGSSGIGLFKQKTALDLEFYRLASANNLLTVALSGTDFAQLTINLANFPIASVSQFGFLSAADHATFSAKYGSGASPSFVNLTLTGNLTRTGMPDGCSTWASGVLGSTGTACGAGGGGGGSGEANTTADVGGGLSLRGTTPKTGTALNLRTLAATGPLTVAQAADLITFSMPAATSGQAGYLTSADWTTFNNKQAALGFTPAPQTSGTGILKGNGTGGFAAAVADTDFASAARGVTNGDTHDHNGGDGGVVNYLNLSNRPTLGDAAAKNTGTGAGDVAAGNHVHSGADITSGTVPGARLPNPQAGVLGGVRSFLCTGTAKLSGIGTDGIPICTADENTGSLTLSGGAGVVISGGPTSYVISNDETQMVYKYFGTGAPGAIVGGVIGDIYQDTATGDAYMARSGNFATWVKLARTDIADTFSQGIIFGPLASDPVSPAEGQCWRNTTLNKLRCRENGVTKDMDTNTGTGGGGGGGTGGTVDYATYTTPQGLTAAGNFNSPPPVPGGTLAVGDVIELSWHGEANMNVASQTYSLSGRVGSSGLTAATSTGAITALTPLGFRVVVQCAVTAIGASGGLACGGISSYNQTSTSEENRVHVTGSTPVAVDTTADLTFQLVIISMGDGTLTQRFAVRKIYKAAAAGTNIGTVSSLESRNTVGDFTAPTALSANTLQVGDLIELSGHGYANMNTASQSYSLEGRVNATPLGAANSSSGLVSANNYAWRVDYRCVVTAIGASGTMECGGITHYNISNTSEEHRVSSPTGTVSVDTTIALTFRVGLAAVGDGTVYQRVVVRKIY